MRRGSSAKPSAPPRSAGRRLTSPPLRATGSPSSFPRSWGKSRSPSTSPPTTAEAGECTNRRSCASRRTRLKSWGRRFMSFSRWISTAPGCSRRKTCYYPKEKSLVYATALSDPAGYAGGLRRGPEVPAVGSLGRESASLVRDRSRGDVHLHVGTQVRYPDRVREGCGSGAGRAEERAGGEVN